MKERPILFSGPMVRAILEGRKTQTRRVVKPQPNVVHGIHADASISSNLIFRDGDQRIHCPYGVPGDRLWVRETWARVHPKMLQSLDPDPDSHEWSTVYRADENGGYVGRMLECTKWRPSIHMPRWASRLTLEITAVRVERLQDISDEDCAAEGIETVIGKGMIDGERCFKFPTGNGYSRIGAHAFQALWDSIYGNWTANPYVWVVEFRKVEDKR